MDLTTAENMARTLMTEHGVGRLDFAFDRAKRRLGACHYYTIAGTPIPAKITLSRHFVPLLSEDEVRDVILHEIAHAQTPGQHHNAVWRAAARKIGARPQRCAAPSVRPPAPIEGRCPTCDVKVSEHHRMPRAVYVHTPCRTRLTYVRL